MPQSPEQQPPEPVGRSGAKTPPSRGAYALVFFSIAIVAAALDLGTKSWIFGRLGMPGETGPLWVWDGVFGFQTALNEGALFGMGQGFVLAFAFLSMVMLLGILVWLLGPFFKNRFLVAVMGLISGGIVGNLFDRLGLHRLRWPEDGYHVAETPVYAVRDWLLVMIGSYHWPNFNLADSYLVVGVILLGISILFFAEPSDKVSPGP